MAIDFPASPSIGQTYAGGGVVWAWDGAKWNASATTGGPYLPTAGGTMTGPIVLAADPTANMQAATKQYTDAKTAPQPNRIINGDCRIDQRNNGASGTAQATYTLDRWQYIATQASKGTWGRGGPSALGSSGFQYYLGFASSSAYTVAVGDYFAFRQAIEADMVSDFQWGAANAQPATLSFWASSSLIGTFGGTVTNVAGTRSYPFTYSLADTAWHKFAITIPGDTAGTWVMNGAAGSINVNFGLGVGATYSGPAGAWASSSLLSANGAVSVVGTNGAYLTLTGVKLEIGAVATPFLQESLAKRMADCQRYFESSYDASVAVGAVSSLGHSQLALSGLSGGANNFARETVFKVTKRADPTIIVYSPNSGAAGKAFDVQNAADVAAAASGIGQSAFAVSATAAAVGGAINFRWHWSASAEL